MAVIPASSELATVGEELNKGARRLSGSDTASLDSRLLLGHVLRRSRSWVLAHPEYSLTDEQRDTYRVLAERRARGEPVAYLTGSVEWFGLEIEAGPGVLIPRPETELLLEAALEICSRRRVRSIADIGTGSGAIAVALAVHLPGARVVAVDESSAALKMAAKNVYRHEVAERVELLEGDLIEPISDQPDLLVANLPYLSESMMDSLPADVRFEPASALYGGQSGMEVYKRLFNQVAARAWRLPILIEIDHGQVEALSLIASRSMPRAEVRVLRDYAQLDRVLLIKPA